MNPSSLSWFISEVQKQKEMYKVTIGKNADEGSPNTIKNNIVCEVTGTGDFSYKQITIN